MRQVYIVRVGDSGSVVKIGVCSDIVTRLPVLQSMNFERLHLIRYWDGDLFEERQLHRYFAPYRLRGEWFTYREEMETVQLRDVVRANFGFALRPGRLVVERTAKGIEEAAGNVGMLMSALVNVGGISHGLFSKWKKGERTVSADACDRMIEAIHKQYEHWHALELEAA